MKKLCFSVLFAVVFFVPVLAVKGQTSAAAFTGAWVLDREKTSSKDFPKKLQNYRMIVGESENLLNVKSQVEGRVEVEVSRDRAADTGPNISPGSVAGSNAGVRSGGPSSVSGETAKRSYSGTLALFFTPRDVTYKLSGEEVKVEIKQGEKVSGFARIKAKLDKSGKTLQLTTIRREKTSYGEMETTTWESWKLSGDGKTLKFQRTVETPTARDELTMFLTRPPAQ
jgi:hypothetical protein